MAKTKKKKRSASVAMVGLATALSLSPLLISTDNGAKHAAHVKATFNPLDFTTGNFEENDIICPPQGKGDGDSSLSKLKNRDKAPAKTYKPMSVAEIIDADLPDMKGWEIVWTKSKRADWSDENRAEVEKLEKQGVTLIGYFLYAEAQHKEMCNCGSPEFVDTHTWLVDNEPDGTTQKELKTQRGEALVAEISPRLHGENKDLHPNYNPSVINKIAVNHMRVKVSGWMTWDQEHKPFIGQTRGTLWEIHPILDIKVEITPGKWKELDAVDVENELKGAGANP